MAPQEAQAPAERNLRPPAPPAYRSDVERWAVLVGISEYQHEPWNLKYAHADALALQMLLQSPSHGGFDVAHMKCLTNKDATTRAITSALRTFLQDASPDDLVLLYFACHGGAAFDGRPILYLYTHDTDPADIPGTALRMDEINRSLHDYIAAKRVIVIADTCHAGGIRGGPPTRAARDDSALLNEYLKDISQSRDGVSMLTSALSSQTSQEGAQWCDEHAEGHGVFTHFLLKGMAGEADGFPHAQKDGKVSLGELFDYVSHHVQQAIRQSGVQQTPWCSEGVDRSLLMAVTGGSDARGQCELGYRLLDLGWRISDPKRFEAAIRRFDEAISLAGVAADTERILAAKFGRGQAFYGLQQHADAIANLQTVVEADATQQYPEAWLYLGLTQARCHDYTAAIHALQSFVTHYPQNEQRAWVEQYIGWLQSGGSGEKYALLIGINQYFDKAIPQLQGCINDTNLMKQALVELGFPEENTRVLLDGEATCTSILAAIKNLAEKTTSADTVVVFFSGRAKLDIQRASSMQASDDVYLFTYDLASETGDWSGPLRNGISILELHHRMQAIPGSSKTLILETESASSTFMDLVEREGDYALLGSARPGQFSFDSSVEVDGKTIMAGAFTSSLVCQLTQLDAKTITYGQLRDATAKMMRSTLDTPTLLQSPSLVGSKDQLIFPYDIYADFFDFAHERSHPAPAAPELARSYKRFRSRVDAPFPQVHLGFGRAFTEKRKYSTAIKALQIALRERPRDAEVLLALARAQQFG